MPRVPATEVFNPSTGVAVYVGPAALPVAFPSTVPAAALDKEKLRAGVDEDVPTVVVKRGLRVPALNVVTVPDVAGAVHTGYPDALIVRRLPVEPEEPVASFNPAALLSRVSTPVIVPPASGRKASDGNPVNSEYPSWPTVIAAPTEDCLST
jgi:hypothetical protein